MAVFGWILYNNLGNEREAMWISTETGTELPASVRGFASLGHVIGECGKGSGLSDPWRGLFLLNQAKGFMQETA